MSIFKQSMKVHFKPCKRLRQWKSEWVTEKVCLELLTAKTKSKSRQRRRLRPCAEKDKAIEPIPKVPNYCHVKLKAFPKMFSSKFCFLLNLAQVQLPKVGSLSFRSEITQSLCFMGQLTNWCKITKMSGKLDQWVICEWGPEWKKNKTHRRRASDGQLAIIGREKFKFGDIGR